MTGGEELSDGPHQQADDRTSCTSHLPLRERKKHIRGGGWTPNELPGDGLQEDGWSDTIAE